MEAMGTMRDLDQIRERDDAKESSRIALIAPTASDARDVMVEGESGLLSVCWGGDKTYDGVMVGRPAYEPSKRRLTWANGAMATLFSAEEPERLRGPQHEIMWADELAAWKYLRETWDMAMFGLRLGTRPRICITTTPKPRPARMSHVCQSPSGGSWLGLAKNRQSCSRDSHSSSVRLASRAALDAGLSVARDEMFKFRPRVGHVHVLRDVGRDVLLVGLIEDVLAEENRHGGVGLGQAELGSPKRDLALFLAGLICACQFGQPLKGGDEGLVRHTHHSGAFAGGGLYLAEPTDNLERLGVGLNCRRPSTFSCGQETTSARFGFDAAL